RPRPGAALQRLSGRGPRRRSRPADAVLRAGDGHADRAGVEGAAQRHGHRVDRPELPAVDPGQGRAGGVPAGDPARLPGAGRAVRELDAAAGGDPERADVHALRIAGRVADRRRQQCVRAGRAGGADGAGVQERDPDRGVRARAGTAGQGHGGSGAGSLPPAPAHDRDDLDRVHRRHRAAGAQPRRGCRGALGDRHHRVLRDDRRDAVRPVPDPGVLRRAAQAGHARREGGARARAAGGGVPWLIPRRAFRPATTSAGCSNSCRPNGSGTAKRKPRPAPTKTRRPHMNEHKPAALALLKVAALSLALSACTVGPDFVRPDMQVPDRFARSPSQAGTPAGADAATATPVASADPRFWNAFGDPQLTALVEQALSANHDLRIALASYDRANALLRGSKFDYFPTITAGAEGSDNRTSADQAPGVARGDRDGESYSAGVNASWELDLFGRIRRGVEAGRAETA